MFAHLDEHSRLAGHMSQSSWMMLGSRMNLHVDDGKGQRVGSVIRLSGKVVGLPQHVEEAVTERTPPSKKVWETIGEPNLLVIGPIAWASKSSLTSNVRRFASSSIMTCRERELVGSLVRWLERFTRNAARAK